MPPLCPLLCPVQFLAQSQICDCSSKLLILHFILRTSPLSPTPINLISFQPPHISTKIKDKKNKRRRNSTNILYLKLHFMSLVESQALKNQIELQITFLQPDILRFLVIWEIILS